jgi:hypothetical protein
VAVVRLHNLPEGALAEQLSDFVPLEPHFSRFDNVVVVFIIVAAIESVLLRKSLLLRIINLEVLADEM